MTPHELLRAINLPDDEPHLKWAKDSMDIAEVLERDEARKPVKGHWAITEADELICPTCHQHFRTIFGKPNFCSGCGQRLDWSEK